MYHTYQLPFTFNTERLGYEVPDDRWCICMTPERPALARPRPAVAPVDATRRSSRRWTSATSPTRTATTSRPSSTGCRIARKVAETAPFADWIDYEIAPGEGVQTRRRAVDLRPRRAPHRLPPVRHLPHGLGRRRPGGGRPEAARCAASRACPSPTARSSRSMVTPNPMVPTYMIGERAADLVRERSEELVTRRAALRREQRRVRAQGRLAAEVGVEHVGRCSISRRPTRSISPAIASPVHRR